MKMSLALLAASSPAQAATGLQRAVGTVAVVQADTRFCTIPRHWCVERPTERCAQAQPRARLLCASPRPFPLALRGRLRRKASIDPLRAAWFWWKSAELNALWASSHGYDHFLVCIKSCAHCPLPAAGPAIRKASWCKLMAVGAVLAARVHDSVLAMDTDAYVNATRSTLPELLSPFTWPGDWRAAVQPSDIDKSAPSLFFACNVPFVEGWPVRPRANSALDLPLERQLAWRGPPNSGFFIARNVPAALLALRLWWLGLPDERAAPHRSWPWHIRWREQGGLWDVMLSNATAAFARSARVLARPHGRPRARGAPLRCLSAMGGLMGGVAATSARDPPPPGHDMSRPRSLEAALPPRLSDGATSLEPIRHLDHHHYKWVSTRSMVMDRDLVAVRASMVSTHTDAPQGRGSTQRVCRTRLLHLDPGIDYLDLERVPSSLTSLRRPAVCPHAGGQRGHSAAASRAGGGRRSILEGALCADDLISQVPLCRQVCFAVHWEPGHASVRIGHTGEYATVHDAHGSRVTPRVTPRCGHHKDMGHIPLTSQGSHLAPRRRPGLTSAARPRSATSITIYMAAWQVHGSTHVRCGSMPGVYARRFGWRGRGSPTTLSSIRKNSKKLILRRTLVDRLTDCFVIFASCQK